MKIQKIRIEVPESERGNIRCDRKDLQRFNELRSRHGWQQHQFLKVLLDAWSENNQEDAA